MVVTFLNKEVSNLKFPKVRSGDFFLESDVQEIDEHGEICFEQRGFIAELQLEGKPSIQIFLPLTKPEYRETIEGSLEEEEEVSFCLHLEKL